MLMRLLALSVLSLAALSALAGCDPCEKLEERICNDLGEADCKIWKDNDRPGFPGTGRRATRSCTNAMGNYDVHLTAVKASVEAYKKAGQTKAKAGSAKSGETPSTPPPPKKQHENCAKLEEKLCADLGEACAKWKENGKPGLIDNFVKCKWAVEEGKGYDEMLKEAKAGST